jgi:argininosuccinate lyase
MPFREAHEVVGTLVYECIQLGIYLKDLPFEQYKKSSELFEEDLYEVINPFEAVRKRMSAGGTGFEMVKIAIEKAKATLN